MPILLFFNCIFVAAIVPISQLKLNFMNRVRVYTLKCPDSVRDLYLEELFFYLSGICESGRYPILHIRPNVREDSFTNYDCIIEFRD